MFICTYFYKRSHTTHNQWPTLYKISQHNINNIGIYSIYIHIAQCKHIIIITAN